MLKVKIIDAANNTVLHEVLFAYDGIVDDAMVELKPFVNRLSDGKIDIITERCKEDCNTARTTFAVSSVILRRINSVNPYNND